MDSLLYSYDLAIKTILYDRFASILGIDLQSSAEEADINLGVFQCPKSVAPRWAAEKRGETFLEFINFWRVGATFSWQRNRTPLSRRGLWVSSGDEDTIHVTAVPIDLSYNAWFWSKDLDKIYQVIEKYVQWQQDNPNLSITYNEEFVLTPDLHFGEIVDESTVDEQFSKGLIYVYRMPIRLDAWILQSTSSKIIHKIRFTLRDKNEITDYEEIFLEDSNQDTEREAALRLSREGIYNISAVDPPNRKIGILGDFADDFAIPSGEELKIKIVDSTDNDGIYTVESASYIGDLTVVIVAEALTSTTADGTVSLKTI